MLDDSIFSMIKIITLLCVILSLFSEISHSQVNPSIEWKTLNTEHFEVIYDAQQNELAKAYATRLEWVYQTLKTYLTVMPEKTIVVINDMTDSPNGYATRIPYPMIMAYPVLPAPGDSISEYGDWPFELLLHEYVHILTFEPVRGVIKPMRSIFGSIITPNMLLPRWWLEGIAVEYETRFSEHGRLRSHYQDSSLRTMVLGQDWNNIFIDEANEQTLATWPQGARPYLFGSLMMSEIMSKSSTEFMNELFQRYGGRAPYFITQPIQEKFQSDYENMFVGMKSDLKKRVENQVKIISEIPLSQSKTFLPEDGESESPALSPDGRYLALTAVTKSGDRSIRIFDREDKVRPFDRKIDAVKATDSSTDEMNSSNISLPKEKQNCSDGPPVGSIGRISWFPDSKKFIFDKVSSETPYLKSSDLHIFDMEKMQSKQLSFGERFREPAVSPTGEKLTFVALGPASTSLAVADSALTKFQVVYRPPMLHRVSYPVFLNEQTLLFSERDNQGNEVLKRFNYTQNISAENPKVVEIKNLKSPLFLTIENSELLFSGEDQGMVQSYAIATEKILNAKGPIEALRKTNLISMTTKSSFDSLTGQLFTTAMTENGFQVLQIDNANAPIARLGKVVPHVYEDRYPANNPGIVKANNEVKLEEDDYSAASYLLPRYWLPTFYFDSTGYGLHAMTSGSDPLGKHTYQLQGGYDSITQQRTMAFLYTNAVTPVTVSLLGAYQLATDSVSKAEYSTKQGTLIGSYPLWEVSKNLNAGLGFSTQEVETTFQRKRSGPLVSVAYNNISQSPYHFTASSGWAADYQFYEFLPELGDYGFEKTKFTTTGYWSKWLPEGHAIKAELHGVYTPQPLTVVDATHSQSFPFLANLLFDGFVIRGYEYDYFIFKNAANLNLEYRFPLENLRRGFGTNPLFFKKLHGAFIFDALTVDGLKMNSSQTGYEKTRMNTYYYSVGGELKWDITLGYHFPMTWVLGYYYRSDYTSPKSEPTTIFFGLQI